MVLRGWKSMKLEIEVRAFGGIEVEGIEDAYTSVECVRVHKLSKDTTLGEVESLLSKLFQEVENGYENPEQCLGKITIRAKKENGEVIYLG